MLVVLHLAMLVVLHLAVRHAGVADGAGVPRHPRVGAAHGAGLEPRGRARDRDLMTLVPLELDIAAGELVRLSILAGERERGCIALRQTPRHAGGFLRRETGRARGRSEQRSGGDQQHASPYLHL